MTWYGAQRLISIMRNVFPGKTGASPANERQLRAALRSASDAALQQIAENVRGVIWVSNADLTRILYVSPCYETIWGRTCRSLYDQPMSFLEAVHPADRQDVTATVLQIHRDEARNLGVYEIEYRILQPDGTVRWIHDHAYPIRGEKGKLLNMIGCAEDITERKNEEEALHDFLDNANDMIQIVGTDHRFVYVNRQWRATLEYGEDEIGSLSIFDIVHPDHRAYARTIWDQVLSGAPLNEFETVFVAKSGLNVIVSGSINAHFEKGQAVSTRSIFRNVTREKQFQAALQQSNEELKQYVDELQSQARAITNLGDMGDLLQSCHSVEEAHAVIAQFVPRILPAASGSLGLIVAGRNLVDVVSAWGETPQKEKVFARDDCWALRRGSMNFVEGRSSALRCRHLEDDAHDYSLCVPLVAQGEALGILNITGDYGASARPGHPLADHSDSVQSIAATVADRIALALANLRLRQELRLQSIRDPLTGLFNRRHLDESLERELFRAARSSLPLTVFMMDLDHFKGFNDRFGHAAGDLMLSGIGNVLATRFTDRGIACRFGGDEIVLILRGTGLDAARSSADALRQEVRQLNVQHMGENLGGLTLSIGVAVYPHHGLTSTELLRSADRALYRAKAGGRNQVVVAGGTEDGLEKPAGGSVVSLFR